MDNYTLKAKERQLELLKKKKLLQDELPHLYGWNWYPWAWDFFNSTNKMNLLCAANQISKSSTQIRKCIDWATDQSKWDMLWGRKPNQFWYLYPSKDVATAEFEKKWVPEFLPRGSAKRDGIYAWRAEYERKVIKAVHFDNGLSIYFKTYAQDPKTLQSGSCYAMFCDEELPVHLYDELNMRLAGTNGYFHMVFTATLGQELWWKAIENIGLESEAFKDAFKLQVSMYDCLKYIDGSKSHWSEERIAKVVSGCKSPEEVNRRVYGKFVKDSGRKYHAFSPSKHYVKPFKIPENWNIYSGVDPGSGGVTGHPSGIVFIAVRPDMKKGYVYKAWRGDGVETTAGDVFEKYKVLRGTDRVTMQVFDWAAKDFGTIATRNGEGFTKAEKSHELGEEIVNTLFKNDMLLLFDDDPEIAKLGSELLALQSDTPKQKAKDDLCDAARYSAVMIPWDFTAIKGGNASEVVKKRDKGPMTAEQYQAWEIQQRRGIFIDEHAGSEGWDSEVMSEIGYWNGEYGN